MSNISLSLHEDDYDLEKLFNLELDDIPLSTNRKNNDIQFPDPVARSPSMDHINLGNSVKSEGNFIRKRPKIYHVRAATISTTVNTSEELDSLEDDEKEKVPFFFYIFSLKFFLPY